MAQHNIPFEDEGNIDTSEQGGASKQQLSRVEKQFDPAHPPVTEAENPVPGLSSPKVLWHQADDERTSEQDEPQKSVHKAYPTDV